MPAQVGSNSGELLENGTRLRVQNNYFPLSLVYTRKRGGIPITLPPNSHSSLSSSPGTTKNSREGNGWELGHW